MNIETLKSSAFYHWIMSNPDWLALSIVVIAFIESLAIAGILVPGVALLAIAAFVAGSSGVDVYVALSCAWLGAVLGDLSSFSIGRIFSEDLLRWKLLKNQRSWILRGESFFKRYGLASIVAGRFIGPIRPIMPLSAGILGMQTRPFVLVNMLSAVAWAPVYILPGFYLGSSIDTGYSSNELALIGLGALVVLATFFYSVRKYFSF